MISERIIKQKFIAQVAHEEFVRLEEEQINILKEKRGVLSGEYFTFQVGKEGKAGSYTKTKRIRQGTFDVDALIEDVRNRTYSVTPTSYGGLNITFGILKKLRFADMKKFGNAKVYNRPTWGIIFGKRYSLLTRLQSEFTYEAKQIQRKIIYQNLKQFQNNENAKVYEKTKTITLNDTIRKRMNISTFEEKFTLNL